MTLLELATAVIRHHAPQYDDVNKVPTGLATSSSSLGIAMAQLGLLKDDIEMSKYIAGRDGVDWRTTLGCLNEPTRKKVMQMLQITQGQYDGSEDDSKLLENGMSTRVIFGAVATLQMNGGSNGSREA